LRVGELGSHLRPGLGGSADLRTDGRTQCSLVRSPGPTGVSSGLRVPVPEPSPALPTYRDRTSLPMKETGVSKAARREARRRAASTAGPARRIATVLVIALPVSQFHVEVYRVNTTNRRRLSNTGAPATNDTWVSTPAVNGQNHMFMRKPNA